MFEEEDVEMLERVGPKQKERTDAMVQIKRNERTRMHHRGEGE